jgi:Flp pilus assembly protein TadG
MIRFARAWKDDRGVAAIEFALMLPILVGLVLLGADGWMRINQVSQMRSALQSGSRYYQGGGADDPSAAQLTLQSWTGHPGDAVVNTVRSCTCGGVGASCSGQCPGGNLPLVFVTLTATGTYSGLMGASPLNESGVVRVR